MNDGQRAHVVERLTAGDSQEQMVQYLMSEGVDEQVARTGVAAVAAELNPGLPAVGALLSESWTFTKQRLDLVGWYVLISLVPLVFIVIPVLIGMGLFSIAPQLVWLAGILGLVAFATLVWVMVIASAGLFYAVAQEERTRFLDGWRWARPRFWQIAWIGLLLTLVLTVGFVALVIPAFILMVYTMFYFLAYLQHEHRGLHALAASTNLVYGRFWAVLGRLAFMMLVIILVSLAITLIFEVLGNLLPIGAGALYAVGEILNTIVSFVLTIVMMRYLVLLYSAAAASAPAYQAEPRSTSYVLYKVLAWIGALLLFALVAGGTVLLSTIAVTEGMGAELFELDPASFEVQIEEGN